MINSYDHGNILMVTTEVGMKIKAGEFKAKCLQLMDEVQRTHSTIIITKYGKPVAKLISYDTESPKPSPFGCMKEHTLSYGDLIEPTGEIWDAERD